MDFNELTEATNELIEAFKERGYTLVEVKFIGESLVSIVEDCEREARENVPNMPLSEFSIKGD